MNDLDEQAERHKATMEFFKSSAMSNEELAAAISAELKRLADEERRDLKADVQSRQCKQPIADDKEE